MRGGDVKQQNRKKNEDSKRNENVNQNKDVGKNKLFLDFFFPPTFKLSPFFPTHDECTYCEKIIKYLTHLIFNFKDNLKHSCTQQCYQGL